MKKFILAILMVALSTLGFSSTLDTEDIRTRLNDLRDEIRVSVQRSELETNFLLINSAGNDMATGNAIIIVTAITGFIAQRAGADERITLGIIGFGSLASFFWQCQASVKLAVVKF